MRIIRVALLYMCNPVYKWKETHLCSAYICIYLYVRVGIHMYKHAQAHIYLYTHQIDMHVRVHMHTYKCDVADGDLTPAWSVVIVEPRRRFFLLRV